MTFQGAFDENNLEEAQVVETVIVKISINEIVKVEKKEVTAFGDQCLIGWEEDCNKLIKNANASGSIFGLSEVKARLFT